MVVSDPVIQVIFTSDVMNIPLKNKVKHLFLKIKKSDLTFMTNGVMFILHVSVSLLILAYVLIIQFLNLWN